MDLFDLGKNELKAPLAYRMRPGTLDEVIGQEHVVGPGSSLRKLIDKDQLHSLILFGPPGTGKTSIAGIIANMTNAHFESILAVTAGVNDIRKIAADASQRLKYYQQKTILFVDEIHRFNKSQQDVLLPFVEDGTLLLIGATTENPLFELNNALLSRIKLYILEPLQDKHLTTIINGALKDRERGLGNFNVSIDEEAIDAIAAACKGDARMALNILETAVQSHKNEAADLVIDMHLLQEILSRPMIKYDRKGDSHYDSISAFIKSIRGSDPDAAIFWLAVMLEGGEDPMFIARRLVIHAAEDIGLADPFALTLASAAAQAVKLVGMPEARIPLAEVSIYLATAPKSNSSLMAIQKAYAAVRESKKITVPLHIADSSHPRASQLMGKGAGYKYPHNYGGYVRQSYLPEDLIGTVFYEAGSRGHEIQIKKLLDNRALPPEE
ncbi:atpase, aaa family [hydrocarbon metagenome]|uniref:Atpase, aaa family n=1 Tax=hydrocarbon metagenome TaxID=938273 RepID=A0A0W8E7C7_9ZZZZ